MNFIFSKVLQSMNAMVPVQSKSRPKGVTLTLHSYIDEPHQNEVYFLNTHTAETISVITDVKFLRNYRQRRA